MAITYPSLFSLAINKEPMVVDVWDPVGGGGGGAGGRSPLVSLDLSTIGSWKMFSFSCMSFKERELSLIKKVCCL